MKTAGEMELQRKLGNIKADMEDGKVVLTHTCKDTSPGDGRSPCSSNGSSLGQWARAKHAGRRITPERMLGEDVSTRAAALRPAGRRAAPAWLAFASLPSKTIWKIQEKGQRLHASLYTIVRRANPVVGALWFRGSMRELFRGKSLPPERENPFPLLSKPNVSIAEYRANVNNNCHIV
jgi:hypothetical protein